MSDRYFPIKTQTACQLKWAWSTVRLQNGVTSSCHRSDRSVITVDNFDTFHNTPEKIRSRELMLDGQWPTGSGCEYCKTIEDTGGFSDRMLHLGMPDQTPPELELDPQAVSVTPTILEIYFSNTCNMSCIYCNDVFSSKIYQENVKFGNFEKNGIVIKNSTTNAVDLNKITDSFWEWMEKNCCSLKRFHILGGEPFYQAQFDKCLDFFDTNPCPDLEFNVVSNIMISTDKLKHHVSRIKQLVDSKKIKRFDLTASIDCFGKEQEYVRYGLDLDTWKRNFDFLASKSWIYLNINQTISILTIKTMPELIEYINNFKKTREVGHYFSIVGINNGPNFLHPGIIGGQYFSNDFNQILSLMNSKTRQEQDAKQYMTGIKNFIESCHIDTNFLLKLATYLDEIDRRRNLNWRTVFPWLEQELNNVV